MVVDDLNLPEPKTRVMAEVLRNLVGEDARALVLLPESPKTSAQYDVAARATANLPYAKTLVANYLNIRDLLGYDKVVMPLAALDVIAAFLG